MNARAVSEQLAERGHQIQVLTSTWRINEVTRRESNVSRTLRLRKYWEQPSVRMTPPLARDRLEVERHNIREAKRALEEFHPDVVVFWNGMGLGRGLLPAIEAQAPVVYYIADRWLTIALTLKGRGATGRAGRMLSDATHLSLGIPRGGIRGDHLIFASRALRNQYQALGARVGSGEIIYPGFAANVFFLQSQHILERDSAEPPRLLFIGRLVPEKGISTLLEALARIRAIERFKQTTLSLVGLQQDKAFLRDLLFRAKELDIANALTFILPLAQTELLSLYSKHDVFVFPSEFQDPFPLSLVEALATGIPTVSSICGGMAEVVRDGDNALAFGAGDVSDLAGKIVWMLERPQEAARLGRAASTDVLQKYTLEHQVTGIEKYLNQTLASPHA